MVGSKHILSILLIIVLVLVVYGNTLNNGFVYDDPDVTINNAMIKRFTNLFLLFKKEYFVLSQEMSYRPVVTFTYFLDYALFGLNPWGYHLINVLLHITNGVLLYTFLASLLKQTTETLQTKEPLAMLIFVNKPLLISLLFVIHPALTEAVNVISFREDLLSFLFYIGTLNIYLTIRTGRKSLLRTSLYALSCILYLFALLSKEMSVTLPIMVLCYEWAFGNLKGKHFSRLFNRYNTGYFIVTFAYLYLRLLPFYNPFERSIRAWNLVERLLTIPWLLLHYFRLAAFPVSLSADYVIAPVKSPVSLAFILPLMIVILVLTASVLLRKRNKGLTFGILFFIITLIPVYNVIPIANPFAERYLYLPLCGFAVITGSFIYLIYETLYFKGKIANRYLMMSLFTLLSIFSLTVIKRNGVWNTDQMLWADTVKKVPSSYRAHIGIGVALTYHGKFDEAIREFKTAAGLNPSYLEAHYNLGNVYYIVGRIEESIEEFKATVRLNPYYFNAQNNLGVVYYKMGRLDEAIPPLETALRLNPRNPKFHADLANAYAQKGKLDEAHKHYQTALMLNPGLVWINYKLRDLSLKKGIK